MRIASKNSMRLILTNIYGSAGIAQSRMRKAFFRIYSDRDAFRFFDRETYPGDQFTDAFVKVMDSRIKGFNRKNDYAWVVEYDREPIGQIQLYDFQTKNTACTIGYFLKRAYWNRGINTRCVQAVCDFALHDMNLVRIEAYAHVDNIASNRSLEKAGFRLEGCLRKKWLIRNQFCDVNLWALTAEREAY